MIISKRDNVYGLYILGHYDIHVNGRHYDIVFRNNKFCSIFFDDGKQHLIVYKNYIFDHSQSIPELKENVLIDFDIENFDGLAERALCLVSKHDILSNINEGVSTPQKQRRKL